MVAFSLGRRRDLLHIWLTFLETGPIEVEIHHRVVAEKVDALLRRLGVGA